MSNKKTFDDHLAEREAQNDYASTKLWNPRPHLLGMIGERALCRYFGIEQDLRDKPAGDGGADLQLQFEHKGERRWFNVDAKTTPYGDWLRVEVGTVKSATVYVLVYSVSEECLGWIWGRDLMKADRRQWTHNTVHAIVAADLRRMEELRSKTLDVRHAP